jgi:hypothetical protein
MSIHFPNASRSYDATRRGVRFWGHDSAMERSFVISAFALQQLQPNVLIEENALLQAFDTHRDRICEIAAKLYARGPRSFYEVEEADVRGRF